LSADKIWILPSADGTAGQFLKTDGAGNLSFDSLSFSTPLAVIGNATAGSEIRLPEDTDNGSHYVALKAADSIASNLTLILPSADGTSGQVLQTNGSGVLSFAGVSASAGTIIQVVQTIKKDTFTGNSTSYVDVTGLSATITPSSSSNKVLVLVNLSLTDQHGSGGGAKLLRGSTDIGLSDTAGSRRRSSFSGSGYTGDGAGESNMQMSLNSSVLDSPATTSATTYKVQIVSNGGNYYGVNATVSSGAVNDPDNSDTVRMVSSITLMEVKG